MSTTNVYYEQAQLSLAAYAVDLVAGMSGSILTTSYVDSLESAGMSREQAKNFANNFTVVSHLDDSYLLGIFGTGFSGTVFEDTSGKMHFAIRGTQFEHFSDWKENIANIGADGVSIDQALVMFNWLQRLIAMPGTEVEQYETSFAFPGRILTSTAIASGELYLHSEQMSVTGHSLGGHLAMLLGRLAQNQFNSVYAYVAPLFNTDVGPQIAPLTVEGLFESFQTSLITPLSGDIGSNWELNKMSQFSVEGDLIHKIGDVSGGQEYIYTESINQGVMDAHSIVSITDALALYSIFSEIDPDIDRVDIYQILRATTSVTNEAITLDHSLKSISTIYHSAYTETEGASTEESRNEYYTNIKSLSDTVLSTSTSSVITLVGKDVLTIKSLAQEGDIAYRYALKALNPFAIVGADYSIHNTNGLLNIDQLSNQYLYDRAKYLYWQMETNADGAFKQHGSADDYNMWLRGGKAKCFTEVEYYKDSQSGYDIWLGVIYLNKNHSSNANKKQIIFGSDSLDDEITGGALVDHLYGGAGQDTIKGGEGDDYIEGNNGNDSLAGGKGNDHLHGGTGIDVYDYTSGDGVDHIYDEDHRGAIYYDSDYLTGGEQVTPDGYIYKSSDGKYTYQLTKDADNSDILIINSSIWVHDYDVVSGSLGIKLQDVVITPPADSTTQPILGDRFPIKDQGKLQYDGLGNVIIDPTRVSSREDVLYGSEGSDRIYGYTQSDIITGKGGNDILEGGEGADIVNGNDGEDEVYANDRVNLTLLGTFANYGGDTGSGLKGDWLTAGAGKDIVFGDIDNDVLFGGGGEDILVGGAGDDIIDGDDSYIISDFNWDVTVDDVNPHRVLYPYETVEGYARDNGGSDQIYGGAGNDRLAGLMGDDYIYGESGNDIIKGDDGSDYLFGGDGDDLITGEGNGQAYADGLGTTVPGNDYIDGGEGNDSLQGEVGDDLIFGGAGNDTLLGDADYLDVNDHGDDYLDGGDGIDYLYGMYGDDLLYGGAGNDGGGLGGISGGAGNDVLYGGDGDDDLFGDDDVIPVSAHGNDLLYGGDGDDRLTGYGGNDRLFGEGGDDSLWGGAGNDLLEGGDGKDTLIGDAGSDVIDGGKGDDVIYADQDDTLIFRPGDGEDVIHGDVPTLLLYGIGSSEYQVSVYDDLDGNQFLKLSYGLNSISIENGFISTDNDEYYFEDSTLDQQSLMRNGMSIDVHGDQYSNTIYGTDQADIIKGYEGNALAPDGGDWLYGQGGADILEGGMGNDYLDGGAGSDVMIGGIDDDIYVVDASGDVVNENIDEGIDTIESYVTYSLPNNVENMVLVGANPVDAIGNLLDNILQGNDSSNTVTGNDGSDVLLGLGGNDYLDGGSGADELFGDLGNDTLYGGIGNDALYGGSGDDTYVVNIGDGSDTVLDLDGVNNIEFGAGIIQDDLLITQYQADDGAQYLKLTYSSAGDHLSIKYGLSGAISSYRFSDGSVLTHAELLGDSAVATEIAGSPGKDVIHGGSTPDRLSGYAGEDMLYGYAGDDRLDGGAGDDWLEGGDGTDSYVLRRGMGTDTITDLPGTQNILELEAGAVLSDLVVYEKAGDLHLYYKGSTDGVVVKDYVSGIAPWFIQSPDDTLSSLEGLIVAEPFSTAESIEQLMESYRETTSSLFYSELGRLGYRGTTGGAYSLTTNYGTRTDNHTAWVELEEQAVDAPYISRISQLFSRDDSFVSAYTVRKATQVRVSIGSSLISSLGAGTFYPASSGSYGFQVDMQSTVIPVTVDNKYVTGGDNIDASGYGSSSARLVGHWVYDPLEASPPETDNVLIYAEQSYDTFQIDSIIRLEQINAGPSDNQITTFGYSIVDGGAGDDVIRTYGTAAWEANYGNNFTAHRGIYDRPYDDRNIGALLYGNGGNDSITGGDANDILIGGDGEDQLDGGRGADIYYISSDGLGYDTIHDTGCIAEYYVEGGMPISRYSTWWYENNGYAGWYGAQIWEPMGLPSVPVISNNDYPALEPLYAAGVLPADTVEFGAGIALTDLTLSWEQMIIGQTEPEELDDPEGPYETHDPVSPLDPGTLYTVLRITLPDAHGVLIPIPHSSDLGGGLARRDEFVTGDFYVGRGLGAGVEQFRFSDGTVISMGEMIELAPPAPDFDPHLNIQPTLSTPIEDQAVQEDEAYHFVIPAGTFTDQNTDDVLQYTVSRSDGLPLPGWLLFDPLTGTFSGLPLNGDVGVFDIKVTATDPGGLSVSDTFSITVNNTNDIPVLNAALDDQSAVVNTSYNFAIPADTFVDIDAGDALSFSAVQLNGDPLPAWLSFNPDTLFFSGTPAAGNTGYLQVKVTAVDNSGATVADDFILNTGLTSSLLVAGADAVNDLLTGTGGADTLVGLSGEDDLSGADGDDLLYGGADNDTLAGGDGNDRLYGEEGDDFLVSSATADASSVQADYLYGGDGNDTLSAHNKIAILFGGADHDHLTGGSNFNVLLGQDGNDTLIAGITGTDYLDGGTGNDILTGNAQMNTLFGGEGDDILDGAGGNDTLMAGAGNDLLYGRDGDDRLYGGVGNNQMYGGAGNDLLTGGTETGGVAGWDYLYGEGGNDTIVTGTNSSVVWGGAGNDLITGGTGTNYLLGDDGDDTITAGAGTVLLVGAAGNDTLIGGSNGESLYGVSGNDTLAGNAGNDTLVGGDGADRYIFARGDGADIVVDVESTTAESIVDIFEYGSNIAHDQLWFNRTGDDLQISIIGTEDRQTIREWYADEASRIEQFHTTDGYALEHSAVEQLVQAMAIFDAPGSGQLSLSPELQEELAPVFATSWQAA